jgi:hypothetical protein
LPLLYFEAIGTEVPFLRLWTWTDGAVTESPEPLTLTLTLTRRCPFAFYAASCMNRSPRVLSAQIVPWEEYGWGISVDYEDGKRVAFYVGSLADCKIQAVRIKGDTAVAARVREAGKMLANDELIL